MIRLFINAYWLWLSEVYRGQAAQPAIENNLAAVRACDELSRKYAARIK